MTSDPIRAAVVGCGRASRTAHYSALKKSDAFEFVAVCDIDCTRADHWSRENNVLAYYHIDELLDKEKLDLVSINTPNGTHIRLATKVAERGINLLIEKPLGMTLPEIDRLIELCDQHGVRLFCVYQNRFNPTNLLLKRAVDKGRFGQLLTANVTVRWRRSIDYYREDNGWRSRRDMARGVFTHQAIHYVDILQWLVGAPAETGYAHMATSIHPIEVETHGAAVVAFKNGVIGSLDMTALSFPGDREGSITLLGEKGTVKVGGKSMNKILEWDFATPDKEDDAQAQSVDYEPPTVYGFGHEEVYRRAARILQTGEGSADLPDGHEGRKAVEIVQGLYESDRTGEVVRFPFVVR